MMCSRGRPIGNVAALLTVMGLVGCNKYEGVDAWQGFGEGEDGLGAVDPVAFPAANLGSGGSRTQPGQGQFQETVALVDGNPVGYFPYLYPSADIADFLRIREDGGPNAAVPTIGAFNFDAPASGPNPVPGTYPCTAPPNYRFDEARDEMRLDQQGSVFASLPFATYRMGVATGTSYVPVAAEWQASSGGQPCQRLKSRAQVEKIFGPFKATGRFMAWLVIDPGAAVYKYDDDPDMEIEVLMGAKRGLDLQKWGWFNRYLLAYLDGGYIPTEEATIMEDGMMKQVVRMRTQRLYYPRSPVVGTNAAGMTIMPPGRRGAGYDVLQARRGDADYSPVCEVWTYDAGGPLAPAQLPRTAEAIEQMPTAMLTPAPTNPYIFCLQVR
jgi:hypothetical protein